MVVLGGKIECPICDWDWEVESDDDRPHLCHQCGYDSKLGDFDEEALNQWKKENGLLEEVPQPGESSGTPAKFKSDSKPIEKFLSVKQLLQQVKDIPYYKEVLEDLKNDDDSWVVTKKVKEYAKHMMENPSSLNDLPPIIVIDGKLQDGAHRISAIHLLSNLLDPKGGWDKKKLKTHFHKKEDVVPFQEQKEEKYIVRTFSESIDDMELVWHRDREDRIVKSLGETDWMIQMDNELPRPLTEMVYIPKNTYHRVIKGNGDLKVRINKLFTEEEKKYSTILIFGPQAVGKSTITKKLGEKLGMKVIGSDEVIDQGNWASEKIWSKGWKIRKQNEYKGMMKYLKSNLGKPVILDVGGSHGVWDGDMLNEILKLIKNYENRFLIIPSDKEGENIEFLRGRLLKRELDAIPSNIRYWEAVLKGDESFGKDFNSYDKNEFTKRLEIAKKDKTRATEMLKYNHDRYKALKSGVEWAEYDNTPDKKFDWDINKLEDYSKFFIDNMKSSGIGNHIIYNKGKSGEELSDEIIEKLK